MQNKKTDEAIFGKLQDAPCTTEERQWVHWSLGKQKDLSKLAEVTGGERKRGWWGCQCQQRCPNNTHARLCILMDHPWMKPEVLPTALSRISCINPFCLSFPLSKIISSAKAFWIPLVFYLRRSPPQPHQTPPLSLSFCPTELNQQIPLPNTTAPFARRGKMTCPSSCAALVINSELQYTVPLRNKQGLLVIMKLGSLIPHANELGGKGITSPDIHKVEDLASVALFKSLTSFLPCKQASKYE